VIGYLGSGSPDEFAGRLRAFRQGLSETGYIEGKNVAIEYRWAHGESGRLPELAADLVSRPVAVIVTPGSIAAALVAKAATTTIPIVHASGTDPVQAGLVASLNHPGGNVTGVNAMNVGLLGKQLGLLHQLLPGAARFAVLVSPGNPQIQSTIAEAHAAGSAMGGSYDQVRIGHQPADGRGVRPPNSCNTPCSRRRGDRMTATMRRREFITLLVGGAVALQCLLPPSLSVRMIHLSTF
jgi:putative ABC transport system substrate-binding protein